MPDSIISRESLEAELRDATERLQALKAEQERLERIIVSVAHLLQAKFGGDPLPPDVPLFPQMPVTRARRFAGTSIRQAIRTLLKERAKPMSVREIINELERGGKRIQGKAQTETVRAILYRSKEFVKNEDRKWTTSNVHIRNLLSR